MPRIIPDDARPAHRQDLVRRLLSGPDKARWRHERDGAIHSGIETMSDDHETLLMRVANGRDRAAFKALFGHFAPRLKAYLVKLGLGDEKAEDLAQETMVTLWQKAHLFDPDKARASTWLFRIARNKFIDHTRRQKYPEVDADLHLGHMASEDETDAPVIEGQISQRMAAALKALNANQRLVIELSFYEELSHSQIAERLDLPLGTVKSRIRTAFAVLREAVGELE